MKITYNLEFLPERRRTKDGEGSPGSESVFGGEA